MTPAPQAPAANSVVAQSIIRSPPRFSLAVSFARRGHAACDIETTAPQVSSLGWLNVAGSTSSTDGFHRIAFFCQTGATSSTRQNQRLYLRPLDQLAGGPDHAALKTQRPAKPDAALSSSSDGQSIKSILAGRAADEYFCPPPRWSSSQHSAQSFCALRGDMVGPDHTILFAGLPEQSARIRADHLAYVFKTAALPNRSSRSILGSSAAEPATAARRPHGVIYIRRAGQKDHGADRRANRSMAECDAPSSPKGSDGRFLRPDTLCMCFENTMLGIVFRSPHHWPLPAHRCR